MRHDVGGESRSDMGREMNLSGQERLYRAWRSRLHGRDFIAREDLDPAAIGAELAHVSILAADADGLRFRLAGSGLRNALGREARGCKTEDFSSCCTEAWSEAPMRALRLLAPVSGRTRTADGGVHFWIRLPMSSDGASADLILCHDRYLPAEAMADPDRAARAADMALRLDAVEPIAA